MDNVQVIVTIVSSLIGSFIGSCVGTLVTHSVIYLWITRKDKNNEN